MSNNPFLKSKESNNRFNFLDDDDSKSSFKESNKSKIKNFEYKASQNSFTQPSKHERTHRFRVRDREGDHRNNRRNNDFRSKQKEFSPSQEIVTQNIDTNNTELFPELTPIKNNNVVNTVETSVNFKDIFNNVVSTVETEKKNPIPPGWLQLSLNKNRQTVIECGPKTAWMIKQEQKEKLEKEQEDDPNYIMFHAIEAMKKNWERYEREYDEYHGDGAYAERFRLSPVYGPEYDTESDEEEEDSEDDL